MITVLTWMKAKPGMEPQLQEALERMVGAVAEQEPGVVRVLRGRRRRRV